jgi:enterochelin esterase-like enzyme
MRIDHTRTVRSLAAVLLLVCAAACAPLHASAIVASDIVSPNEAGTTRVRVLLPTVLEKGRTYPVVYVLPVEAQDGDQYGDGLAEVRKDGLADKYHVIFVAPTFSYVPWYADNPADPRMRQETYLLRDIVPFVESRYPARHDRAGRFLLGFSKSGWGAFSLLLRHPQMFEKALAWDSPLMMTDLKRGATRVVFANQRNFERYHVTRLMAAEAAQFHAESRFVVLGYRGFRRDLRGIHAFMRGHRIAHVYRDGPPRDHRWDSGWLPGAVALLLSGVRGNSMPGRLSFAKHAVP